MTPEQKIKYTIILQANKCPSCIICKDFSTTMKKLEEPATGTIIDEVYEELFDEYLADFIYEFRQGECETNLPCPSSRHYEANSVAAEMFDGSWVGWTYWFGGGKHGEPESIDWMEDAYEVVMREELQPVKIFTRKQ